MYGRETTLRDAIPLVTVTAAALATVVALAGAPEASADAPRCPFTTAAIGEARKVYSIPHGCIWLAVESRGRSANPPLVVSRVHGKTRRFRLPRTPFGAATGYCWVNAFVVQWPYVVVSVAPEVPDPSGGSECRGGFDGDPMTWIAQFNRLGTSRTVFTSRPVAP